MNIANYLALWLYRQVIDHDSAANFVHLNAADQWPRPWALLP